MASKASTRLIFSGKKCFWKSSISIDIILIQHYPAHVIEIIAYDRDLQYEAPHRYVDESALLAQLDSSAVARNRDSSGDDRAKAAFIFDSIVVSNHSNEPGKFEVGINFNFDESLSEDYGVLVAKPDEVVAFTSPFVQSFR